MIRLIRADCRDILNSIPPGSADLVIMDPPYLQSASAGSGAFGGSNRKYYETLKDMSGGFSEEILSAIDRAMKRVNLYAFCSKKQIKFYLDHYADFRRDGKRVHVNFDIISWHKSNPIPATCNIYLRDTEYCLFFREKGVKLYGDYHTKSTYYISPVQPKTYHPAMKPLELVKRFVINSSQEGQTILDPFMGSGTAAIAAGSLGRNFVGVEIDPSYFSLAEKRVRESPELAGQEIIAEGNAQNDTPA